MKLPFDAQVDEKILNVIYYLPSRLYKRYNFPAMTNPILLIMSYNMTPQAIINEPHTNQEKIEKPGVK